MYKHILLPTDGSELSKAAVRHGIALAKAIGANWTRLHDAGTEYIGWAHLEPDGHQVPETYPFGV